MVARDDELIRELQVTWMQAWIARDFVKLEQVLAHDFSLIVSAKPDQQVTRAKWLALARDSYRGTSFLYDSMVVRIFGDIAVVASVASQTASVNGVDRSGQFFLTDVWRRVGETWQVVARHSSQPEQLGASATRVTSHG